MGKIWGWRRVSVDKWISKYGVTVKIIKNSLGKYVVERKSSTGKEGVIGKNGWEFEKGEWVKSAEGFKTKVEARLYAIRYMDEALGFDHDY